LGRALYSCLFTILREQGFFQAYAGITLPNPGSVGLHEAVGFRPIAVFPQVGYKMGRWLDVGWWQLQLQAASGEPTDPLSFGTIRDSAAVAEALEKGIRSFRSK
jgi:phosphinothricin acetyltransferase